MSAWISYTSQNIPGNQSFELGFHRSLREAETSFRQYRDGADTDECTMTLYSTIGDSREEMVKAAKEFENIGCPFDYPDKLIETGPLGGVKISNT